MKVVLRYVDSAAMTGMKRYTLELATALSAAGATVALDRRQVREVKIGGRAVGGFIGRALDTWMPVRGEGLVHATDHKSNPRPSAQIVTIHDIIPYEAPHLLAAGPALRAHEERTVRRALRGARVVLTDTEYVRNQLLRLFGASPERVRTIHLGVRHDLFLPDDGPLPPGVRMQEGRLNVLVGVRTDLRKRADLVLAAAAELPFVHVIQIGGDAPHPRGRGLMAAIVEKTARLEREGRWTRLPAVDDETLRRLMSQCDLFIHPSVAEGFSLPPLEALACGARVWASDIPVHREVLGEAATFFPLEVAALRTLLQRAWDRRQFGALGAGGPGVAHARRFIWGRTAEATVAAYESAESTRPSPVP